MTGITWDSAGWFWKYEPNGDLNTKISNGATSDQITKIVHGVKEVKTIFRRLQELGKYQKKLSTINLEIFR